MRLFYVLLFSIFLLSSCSALSGSRKMDMSPFSDNTASLFGEANKISRTYSWKHFKPHEDNPEFRKMFLEAVPLIESLRGIVYYSYQVVAINNAKLSDKQKNKQLANYLKATMERALANQKVDSLQLDVLGAGQIFENIRNAKTFLEAIAAADPIVHTVKRSIFKRLDKIENHIPLILAVFDKQIELDYGDVRRNYLRLKDLQKKHMLSITRLYMARIGNRSEIDTLLQEDVSLKKYIPSAMKASLSQMASAENRLLEQLNKIDILLHQLDGVKAEFLAKKDEVTQWRTQVDEKITIARTSITIWAQSHRNLGNGIPVAPLIDVAGIAAGLAGTAAKTVIP